MNDEYDLDAKLAKKEEAGSLLKRLKKASSKSTENVTMADTDFFNIDKYGADTGIYAVNLALSGKLVDGGITPGIHVLAGKQATYKSILGVQLVKAYMDKFEDSICVFLDSEFGMADQMANLNMPLDRIIHVPISNLEILKYEMTKKLKEINEGDHVIFFLDSLGMISSIKAITDMEDEKATKDMTRAQVVKSFFMTITSELNIKKIPFVVVNHSHATFDKYNPEHVSGGSGVLYAAQNIFLMQKAKFKDADSENKTDNDLAGFRFTISLFKSRFSKQGSKIPLFAKFGEPALNKYTGLYELATLTGDIYAPSRGWRAALITDPETGLVIEPVKKYREGEIRENPKFWEEIMFKQTNFIKNVEKRYSLSGGDFDETDDSNLFKELDE